MHRFACVASLLIAFGAPIAAAAADPAPACLQPVARFAFAPNPGGPEAIRLSIAPGSVAIYSDRTLAITSNDRASKPVTVSRSGDQTRIMAEQLWLPWLGNRDGFLYDRPGARCPLDQLPKELQVAL
jgi:hypothetical protein